VGRVRMRARRHLLWLRHLWDNTPGALGLSISYEEVERLLLDDVEVAEAQRLFYNSYPQALALAEPIGEADAAVAADPTLQRVRAAFDLDDAEFDLLSLTVAVEADPWLRRVCAFIHDDATSPAPTPWLAHQLFGWPAGTRVGPNSNVARWHLAGPTDGQANPWSVTAGWAIDPFFADWLLGGSGTPHLGDAARLVWPAGSCFTDRLYPEQLAEMIEFVQALEGARSAGEIVVSGPAGAGKRTVAAQLCSKLGLPLVIVNTGTLLGPGADLSDAAQAVIRIERSARLLGAAVYWHDADSESMPRRVVPPAPVTFLGVTSGPPPRSGPDVVRRTVCLPALTRADRVALWETYSSLPPPRPVLEWILLPADIARAAAAAPAGPDAVADACRATTGDDDRALASPLPRPFTWDDIVLPASVRQHLGELEAQARLRWPVYEEWGFERLVPMGRGISALFAGPSGTGKTMAAQVLAGALDMELHRIDLSEVMSKYIGDTEKNLRKVFERTNCVLFFDEADALFGQRTSVKDAHDRFANIEIDYLLQRMEQYDGFAVLATNRKHEIDPAFLRRFRFIIDFLPPGVGERRELWKRALPARAPNGEILVESIDFDLLAERLTMTGADIKAAALAAAFLARNESVPIGMRHVMHAARRELAKRGHVIRMGELER
jgi:AAA+ superfamily predicted ATPase